MMKVLWSNVEYRYFKDNPIYNVIHSFTKNSFHFPPGERESITSTDDDLLIAITTVLDHGEVSI